MADNTKKEFCMPITVSEAFRLLEPLSENYKDARSNSSKIFKETLEYTRTFLRISDKGLADDFRQSLAENGFTNEEIAVLGSILPQSADEAKICIPSISRLDDSIIEQIIEKIRSLP